MEALYHEWTQPKVQDHVDERRTQSSESDLVLEQDVQHHQIAGAVCLCRSLLYAVQDAAFEFRQQAV